LYDIRQFIAVFFFEATLTCRKASQANGYSSNSRPLGIFEALVGSCTEGHSPTGSLHVDLEDSILAGYSLFTPGEAAKVASCSLKGTVQAYVQFKQPLPDGFQRLGFWPVDLFSRMAPPRTPEELKRP
jgi:hypothetical protein